MNRLCIKCQEEINPLRIKVLPSAKTCVDCSTERPKRGRILTLGSGDHTYNEIEILDEETYNNVMELEESRGILKRKKKVSTKEDIEEEVQEVVEDLMRVPVKEDDDEEDTYVDLYERDEE